jgi:peptidoglycan hydrolase-like protein with peptidoglycan-binding domain
VLRHLAFALALLVPAALLIETVPAQTRKKSAKKTAAKKTVAKKTPTRKTTAKKSASKQPITRRSRAGARTTPTRRVYQTQPAKERLTEIQQALFDRGYLKAQPDGAWGAESEEALRRFQEDQNIRATGKLNSLSLIALGLGPKRAPPAQLPEPPKADSQ